MIADNMVTNRAKPGLEVPAFAGNMKGVGLASALFAGGLGMLVSTRGVVSARSGTVASIGMRSFWRYGNTTAWSGRNSASSSPRRLYPIQTDISLEEEKET